MYIFSMCYALIYHIFNRCNFNRYHLHFLLDLFHGFSPKEREKPDRIFLSQELSLWCDTVINSPQTDNDYKIRQLNESASVNTHIHAHRQGRNSFPTFCSMLSVGLIVEIYMSVLGSCRSEIYTIHIFAPWLTFGKLCNTIP